MVTGANRQPALAVYTPGDLGHVPFAIKVLTFQSGLIAAITGFVTMVAPVVGAVVGGMVATQPFLLFLLPGAVALLFVLFDIEVAFLYPFALAIRELGWFGYAQLLTFFSILLVGYVYVWRKGALDWNSRD